MPNENNEVTQEITISTNIELAVFCHLCSAPVEISDLTETENSITKNDGLELHIMPCKCLK